MESFEQRTAFVTGAANGIGLGIARNLARAGANVAIADIDSDSLDAACADVAQQMRDGRYYLLISLGWSRVTDRGDTSVAFSVELTPP